MKRVVLVSLAMLSLVAFAIPSFAGGASQKGQDSGKNLFKDFDCWLNRVSMTGKTDTKAKQKSGKTSTKTETQTNWDTK